MSNKKLVALMSGWISLLIAASSIVCAVKFDDEGPLVFGVIMLTLIGMITFMAIDEVQD
jgi:hypothetical protein